MKKVLVLYSSPLKKQENGSISCKLAKKYLELYKKEYKGDSIIEMDLNNEPMANINLNSNNFKTFFNEMDSDKYIEQLKNVDKLIIVAPMINFNYPVVLKNYLDHILVANKTFKYKYDSNGQSEGLLKHLHVQLITTQGADFGWYPWGNVEKMLRGTCEFFGAKINDSIVVYGTKTPMKIKVSHDELINESLEQIKKSIKSFK